jgi:hypothetical protein
LGFEPVAVPAPPVARPKSSTFTWPDGRDDDVARLEVAVHDAVLVGRLDPGRDVAADVDGFVHRYWSAGEAFRQRFPRHELEHQITALVDLFDAVDGRDVGVGERREHARLALES